MGVQQVLQCVLAWLLCTCLAWAGDVVSVDGGGQDGSHHTAESWMRAQKVIHKHVHSFLPKIDEDADGKMSLKELYSHLGVVMRRQHANQLEDVLKGMFAEADTDRSKTVSFVEYLKYELEEAEASEFGWTVTGDVHAKNLDKYAKQMFLLLDLDSDGKLSADEFAARTGIDGDIMQLMHIADADGDSFVSRSEIIGSAGRIPSHLEHFLAYDEL